MVKEAEKKVSGGKRKFPDEDAVSGESDAPKKVEETALQEEGQQDVEGAYDELSGEEDEAREEYADGMQMHHPADWVKTGNDWTPVYRGLNGTEAYRKVCNSMHTP